MPFSSPKKIFSNSYVKNPPIYIYVTLFSFSLFSGTLLHYNLRYEYNIEINNVDILIMILSCKAIKMETYFKSNCNVMRSYLF